MNDPIPPPPDQADWDRAARDFAADSLTRIRASADRWVGTISGVLGVFGGVALLGGKGALSGISGSGTRLVIVVALGAAGALALAAIVVGALAAHGTTKVWEDWTGETFAAYVVSNGTTAARQLNASRWLGLSAAALVFGTGIFAATGQISGEPKPETLVLVVGEDGSTWCGPLTSVGGQLRIGDRPAVGLRLVQPVPRCP